MSSYTDDDLALAWRILVDLSDRSGVPEWLGEKEDDAARGLADAVATIIAEGKAA